MPYPHAHFQKLVYTVLYYGVRVAPAELHYPQGPSYLFHPFLYDLLLSLYVLRFSKGCVKAHFPPPIALQKALGVQGHSLGPAFVWQSPHAQAPNRPHLSPLAKGQGR